MVLIQSFNRLHFPSSLFEDEPSNHHDLNPWKFTGSFFCPEVLVQVQLRKMFWTSWLAWWVTVTYHRHAPNKTFQRWVPSPQILHDETIEVILTRDQKTWSQRWLPQCFKHMGNEHMGLCFLEKHQPKIFVGLVGLTYWAKQDTPARLVYYIGLQVSQR